MSAQHSFILKHLMGLLALGLGCGGTLDTGKAKKPVNNKPAEDGTCPSGQSRCGTGVFAVCVDLQGDSHHCGACDRQCSPGIACATGVCQQTVCTGTSLPFSGQPTTGASGSGLPLFVLGFGAKQILADVNGDARLDRIEWLTFGGICDSCPWDLSEFRVAVAQSDGSFASPDTYRASAVIDLILATDVNSDGLADLYVVSSRFENSAVTPYHVELWLGEGDGHLRRSDSAGIGVDGMANGGFDIAIGDLSGDGWPDLVGPTPDADLEAPPRINVYLSDSTGALHLAQTLVAWPGHAFIRDWNGDGSPDLALLFEGLEILYNRGDGTLEQPVDCALSVGSVTREALLVEDFNRDGRVDLVTPDFFGNRIGVLLGLGGCGFAPISYYDLPGSYVGLLRAADMNGDGILDIVSISGVTAPDPNDPGGYATVSTDNLLVVLLGRGDGTFQLQDDVISLGPRRISDVTIGEITSDGRPDIVVASVDGQTGQVSTWENTCQ